MLTTKNNTCWDWVARLARFFGYFLFFVFDPRRFWIVSMDFKNYFVWAKKNYLNDASKVIEIGSNDGTFLENFKNSELIHCGFEPSENVANNCRARVTVRAIKMAPPTLPKVR